MIATGGKTIEGACIGILMLESQFPRIVGDGGNALTWPFPMLYKVVKEATPDRVVRRGAQGLLDAFIEAGRELVANGADGITTNCGFLVRYQPELADALKVPVASSSLLQIPLARALMPPGRDVGVVTISGDSLTPELLAAAGAPQATAVIGVPPEGAFASAILNDQLTLDVEAARSEVVRSAEALVASNPQLGAIVLECTNMGPYSADVAAATGLPVYDFRSLVTWFHAGLRPPRHAA